MIPVILKVSRTSLQSSILTHNSTTSLNSIGWFQWSSMCPALLSSHQYLYTTQRHHSTVLDDSSMCPVLLSSHRHRTIQWRLLLLSSPQTHQYWIIPTVLIVHRLLTHQYLYTTQWRLLLHAQPFISTGLIQQPSCYTVSSLITIYTNTVTLITACECSTHQYWMKTMVLTVHCRHSSVLIHNTPTLITALLFIHQYWMNWMILTAYRLLAHQYFYTA